MTVSGADPGSLRVTDYELLAEYAEGLLDDTPDGDRIARLVADDAAWRTAYERILPATDQVAGQLAELAVEPMPTEVAERLDAVLVGATADAAPSDGDVDLTGSLPVAGGGTGAGSDVPAEEVDAAAAGSGSNVRPLSDARSQRSEQRSRRSRRRLTAIVGAAAAVVFVLCGGVVVTGGFLIGASQEQNSAGAPAPRRAPGESKGGESGGADSGGPGISGVSGRPVVAVSGTVWQPSHLAGLGDAATRAGTERSGAAPAPDPNRVPAELRRLTGTAAVADCAEAVRKQFTARFGRPEYFDLAKFRDSAAVLAVLGTGANQTVLVVHPNCGLNGRADLLYGPIKV